MEGDKTEAKKKEDSDKLKSLFKVEYLSFLQIATVLTKLPLFTFCSRREKSALRICRSKTWFL